MVQRYWCVSCNNAVSCFPSAKDAVFSETIWFATLATYALLSRQKGRTKDVTDSEENEHETHFDKYFDGSRNCWTIYL